MINYTPPPNWHIGPAVINVHSTAFCLGAVAAYIWTTLRLPKQYRDHLDNLAVWMTLGGIIGARLLYVVINYNSLHSFWQILAFWQGGLVSYGGFVGALTAWVIYIRGNKLPLATFCHALGPAAVLGWGVGRFGCFFNWYNEYGTVTDVPWAFIVNSDPPRHPVMLYLALGHCLMSFVAAHLAERYKRNAAGVALMAFGLVRLVLDYWRDYSPSWLWWGSEAVSLTILLVGLVVTLKMSYPEAEAKAEELE